ncbi:hypothetical protein KIPB_006086, partial [Kipferlia bialata]
TGEDYYTYETAGMVTSVKWSPDSLFVAAVVEGARKVHVFSKEETDWDCTIGGGPAGLTDVKWTPDSRHIITISDYGLEACVWSLTEGSELARWINPNLGADGIAFSPSFEYMACVVRLQCKDHIVIRSLEDFEVLLQFRVSKTPTSVVGIEMPSDGKVVVWDTPMTYRILVCKLPDLSNSPDPNKVETTVYNPYSDSMGVKACTVSHRGHYIAAGGFDERLRVLDTEDGALLASLEHSLEGEREREADRPRSDDMCVYVEVDGERGVSQYASVLDAYVPAYEINERNPGLDFGVSCPEWSPDDLYIATHNQNMPHAVWIWSVDQLSLRAVILQSTPVSSFKWAPTPGSPMLAITSLPKSPTPQAPDVPEGHSAAKHPGRHVTLWTVEGVLAVGLPKSIPSSMLDARMAKDSITTEGVQLEWTGSRPRPCAVVPEGERTREPTLLLRCREDILVMEGLADTFAK